MQGDKKRKKARHASAAHATEFRAERPHRANAPSAADEARLPGTVTDFRITTSALKLTAPHAGEVDMVDESDAASITFCIWYNRTCTESLHNGALVSFSLGGEFVREAELCRW